MPDRMASASLSCFLQPAKKTRSPMRARTYEVRFMRVSSSLPITHPKHDDNVKDGEDSKGITKWAVNDVPQVKNLLGAGQEKNSLGQGRLLSRGLNGNFQFRFARRENSEKREEPRHEPCRTQAKIGR